MTTVSTIASIVRVLVAGARMCVFRAEDADGDRLRYVVVDLPRIPCVGETWHIEGEPTVHPVHGPQIAVARMSIARPVGQLLARLLAGPRFPGVGAATADKLWGAFGEHLVDVIDAGDRGAMAKALGDDPRTKRQIETILLEWPEVDAEPRVLAGLDRIGVPAPVAAKLLLIYGADALERLHQDPYRLLAFAGWKTVDRIALRMGVATDDARRTAAACEAALHERLTHGDTLMGDKSLRMASEALIGAPIGVDTFEAAQLLGAMRRRDTGWQASGPALMEEAIAQRIADDLATGSRPAAARRPTEHDDEGIELNPGQVEAVAMTLREPVSLLVGGAGTGKTTTLKAIHRAATAAGIPVEMMALSGRAALRIREATGAQARTIAGWLAGVTAGLIDLSTRPLIVIDEASMVDLGSLYRIMRAAPVGCSFLLVGDDGQLPPVGFGLTFHALLGVKAIPRTMLIEVMRQAAETGIPAFAQAIREGRLPEVAEHRADIEVGVSIAVCRAEDVVDTAVKIRRAIPGARIVGSIKGAGTASDGGTAAMNQLLHDAWAEAHALRPAGFLKGEPVMWTVNDYDLDLWNGSLGRVSGMTDEGLAIRFDEGDRVIALELLANLEPAWAITTHKAQGSAFDTVIVPVTGSRILDRTLLYTAITRARRRVILVGDPTEIRAAIGQPPHSSRRATWLSQAVEAAIFAKTAAKAA